MPYDSICSCCPYLDQRHLANDEKTERADPPVEVESNGSDTLIVAQAPGVEEWKQGTPLLPTKKQGGTAGARIKQSWDRKGKNRESFDIIEAVQCYPGRGCGKHNKKPDRMAILACSCRLRRCLIEGQYTTAIALGNIAFSSLHRAKEGLSLAVVKGPHPTGGNLQAKLDRLWCP